MHLKAGRFGNYSYVRPQSGSSQPTNIPSARQINQIFTPSPHSRNMLPVTSLHHVALLTGRVPRDGFGGSGLSFLIYPRSDMSHEVFFKSST
jgi:hypothetical protein